MVEPVTVAGATAGAGEGEGEADAGAESEPAETRSVPPTEHHLAWADPGEDAPPHGVAPAHTDDEATSTSTCNDSHHANLKLDEAAHGPPPQKDPPCCPRKMIIFTVNLLI